MTTDNNLPAKTGFWQRLTLLSRHLLARIILAMCLGIGAAYIFPLWTVRIF